MAEQRLRFLADAGALLASSLDVREILKRLADALVPDFADWCTISVLEDDGVVRRVAGAHKDPALAPVMAEYLAGFQPTEHRNSTMTEAIKDGRTFYFKEVSPEFIDAAAQNEDHRRILRTLGCTSSIIAPLLARGTSIGALSLSMSDRSRTFEELDHAFARELGVLAGLAVDNARRTAHEQKLLAEAKSANRAKDEFLAMLGHELRNPLAPIVTALELMRIRGGAPERELDVIERQTKHLTRLVDDLLDVSRIARGGVELHRAPVDTARIVKQAIEMAELLFEQKRHRLSVDVPEGLVLDGDPTRLAQVVANLLTNAAKYTPSGGAISVTAQRRGPRIAIRVRDNGIGIPAHMLARVFEMFVQERQGIERERGGLGLGLTIVKNLVEAHGGTVVARSEGVGKGSEFELELPASSQQVALPLGEDERPERASTSVGVFIVDDNEDAAALIADSLGDAGYVTRVAHDATEALAAAQHVVPMAAILDIGLPVIDGYELARRLRALPGWDRVTMIAITGYGQPQDRERALAAGFDHHLVKPVTIAAIRELLDAAE